MEGNALPLEERFKKYLGVPEDKRMPILIPIGVPVETPDKEKKALDAIVHWEQW